MELKSRAAFWISNRYITVGAAALITCLLTIINGYPILYSDTSTYLSAGFELETPFDRPITYGLLLRLLSLNGASLMFVPLFQSLVVIYVLYQVLNVFTANNKNYPSLFFLTLLLCLFTGFGWSVNQLLPDFLAALGFLCLLCIFMKERNNSTGLYILFFISAASHISNFIVYTVLLLLILLLRKKFLSHLSLRSFWSRTLILLALLAVSFLIMTSAISKSRHIFYAGSLAQKGILQKILVGQCGTQQFKLCRYVDSIPKSFEAFVWKPESPLYKIGGWKAARPELKKINALSLGNSEFLFMQLKQTSIFFARQLVMFDVGEGNGAFLDNTILIQRIKKYAAADQNLCTASAQSRGSFLHLKNLNIYYTVATSFLAMLLIWLIFKRYRRLHKNIRFLLVMVFALITLSAFLVAFSSEVSHRHGLKLVWLVTLLNFILLSSSKKQSGNTFQP